MDSSSGTWPAPLDPEPAWGAFPYLSGSCLRPSFIRRSAKFLLAGISALVYPACGRDGLFSWTSIVEKCLFSFLPSSAFSNRLFICLFTKWAGGTTCWCEGDRAVWRICNPCLLRTGKLVSLAIGYWFLADIRFWAPCPRAVFWEKMPPLPALILSYMWFAYKAFWGENSLTI